ncbi:hypothetical protein ACNKHV_24820 [Shigella flexneri]
MKNITVDRLAPRQRLLGSTWIR